MRMFSRYATLFILTSFTLLSTLGGCAKIGEAIDCEQMCDQLQTCVDGDLDTHRCADRCEDKTDTSAMRNQLDDCTDCLDQGYACAEISDQCPMCKDVTDGLL
jgi:hypothetical protein